MKFYILWSVAVFIFGTIALGDSVTGIKTSLDPIKLQTVDDIKRREQAFTPIYSFYKDATLSRVVQLIEKEYGSWVYYFIEDPDDNFQANNPMNDEPSIMSAAVSLFLDEKDVNLEGTLDNRCSAITGFFSEDCEYRPATTNFTNAYSLANPLDKIKAGLISGVHQIEAGSADVPLVTLKQKKGVKFANEMNSPYLLNAIVDKKFSSNSFVHHDFSNETLSTTDQRHLYEAPVVDYFTRALEKSGVKSLDATIVFLSRGNAPYVAIYPDFTPYVPIPQPILYISFDATQKELDQMIETEAPRVYAYNKLFSKNLLPQVQDLESVLSRYPKLENRIAVLEKGVEEHNKHEFLKEVFLDATYASLWGGLGATAILMMNPVLLFDTMLAAVCTSQPDGTCDD